jgi:hypothetical protein
MNSKMNSTEMDVQTISARQLREILFYLDNQDMTVRELRKQLFSVELQDKQVEVNFSMYDKLSIW